MKKLPIIAVALIASIASCSKPAVPGSDVGAPASAPEAHKASAYIMLHGLSLWTKDGESVVYAKSATLADRVEISGKPIDLDYKGTKREYSLVRFPDGAEYYARTPYVVSADQLAVVRDVKCVYYTEPRIIGATTNVVPRLSIVAVVDPTITDGFIKVSYAKPLPEGIMVTDKWIKRDTIVDADVDVQAAVSLAVVNSIAEKDRDLKVNILEGAAESYSSSAFFDDISNMLLSLNAFSLPELAKESVSGMINADDVNVRSAPSSGSESFGKLNKGDAISAEERTAEKYEIEGLAGYWYHIVSPIDGWVFGPFIDAASMDNVSQ